MPLRQIDLANTHTAGQSHGANVASMLAQRLPTLAQHLVSVAVLGLLLMPGAVPSKHETLTQYCFNVGPTSSQHLNTIGS